MVQPKVSTSDVTHVILHTGLPSLITHIHLKRSRSPGIKSLQSVSSKLDCSLHVCGIKEKEESKQDGKQFSANKFTFWRRSFATHIHIIIMVDKHIPYIIIHASMFVTTSI